MKWFPFSALAANMQLITSCGGFGTIHAMAYASDQIDAVKKAQGPQEPNYASFVVVDGLVRMRCAPDSTYSAHWDD